METVYKEDIVNKIKEALLDRGETIAVAESVTSGHIQAAVSLAIEASKVYQGGMTVYNLGQKVKHLNVEPITANDENCVSCRVADSMALNIARLFISDYGVSITGYASVVPENEEEGIFAYVALSYKNKIILNERIQSEATTIFEIQVDYTNQVLVLIHQWLLGNH